MAKAAKLNNSNWRTYVITGDGEMQEGSNWEAIMAATQFQLDNLTLIIDHNRLQQGARLDETNQLAPFAPKFKSFGWDVEEIDGNDMEMLCSALSRDKITLGRPRCVIAHTNKGHGISFISDRVEWHHKVPNDEEMKLILEELSI